MTSRSAEEGFSIVELAIVMVVLGILFVIASAMFTSARMNGNEAAALGSMRAINHAQFSYLNSCGGGYYASSLLVLGHKSEGSQGFIGEELGSSATPIWTGYRFTMTNGAGSIASGTDCMLRPTISGYYASGVPLAWGETGIRSFGTNERGTIWQLSQATAPTEPFGPPAEQVR